VKKQLLSASSPVSFVAEELIIAFQQGLLKPALAQIVAQ